MILERLHPGDPHAYYDQHGNRYLLLTRAQYCITYARLLLKSILHSR